MEFELLPALVIAGIINFEEAQQVWEIVKVGPPANSWEDTYREYMAALDQVRALRWLSDDAK